MKTIRVLVADESVFVRQQITKMLSGRADITIIGGASNGGEAVVKVLDLLPNVVVMGCKMPLMNGFEAMKKIIELTGIPVIMLIINSKKPENDIEEARSNGASDWVVLKSAFISNVLLTIKVELIDKILKVSEHNTSKIIKPTIHGISNPKVADSTNNLPPENDEFIKSIINKDLIKQRVPNIVEIVVIGVSTGGPMALHQLVPKLPANFPVPIVIVQHMPAHFTATLAIRLNEMSDIQVTEAVNGMNLSAGSVYIAKGGKQIQVTKDRKIRLSDDDFNVIYKPSIDVLVNSIIDVYGGNVVGVMMTGLGNDGVLALKQLHRKGGYIIAQDEQSSIVFGMPKAVIDAQIVNEISSLNDLAQSICFSVGIKALTSENENKF